LEILLMTTAKPIRRTRLSAAPAPTPSPALAPAGEGVNLDVRHSLEYLPIADIAPYPYNARDNTKAIPAVASSIRQFGFLVPVVVDAQNVLVAGHTRVEAAKLLGMVEVPAIRATGLTEQQIAAFRIADNKVAEIAEWDNELLAQEIANLQSAGINWTTLGFRAEEIDCLSALVAEECLTAPIVPNEEEVARTSALRAPLTTRFTLGTFHFFIPTARFREWEAGVRELCNNNAEAVTEELKRRLQILD
jgi:hypothetical protein